MAGNTRFRFGSRSLDPVKRELRVDGRIVDTEPKVFDLIEYLLRHRDRVVSKQELQDALWPGVVVTEASLSRSIMKARRALDDDAREPAVIRTVARRGFRFVATIDELTAQAFEVPGLSDVHFVNNAGLHIAWRTLGKGPRDMLLAAGFVSHLDNRYRIPHVAGFDSRLRKGYRLISFDKRSVGLSDRIGRTPTLDDTVADMLAVLDAAGARRAVVFAISESGPAACLLAARHPERVTALVLYGTFARGTRAPDFPHMPADTSYDAWLERLIRDWGGPASIELFAPSMATDPVARDAWAHYLRSAASPGIVRGILQALRNIDVRDSLASIRCPTLVLHRRDDRMIRIGAGRDLAERIPGARFVDLPGQDHWCFVGDTDTILNSIHDFLRRCQD